MKQGHAATFLPPAISMLNSFQPYTEADVAKVIKWCELNPISTESLKQFLLELLSVAIHKQDV